MKLLGFFLVLLWLIEIVNLVVEHRLNQFALLPRDVSQLYGIVSIHFLHWNFGHLFSNTLPVAILGIMVCIKGNAEKVTLSIMLITGTLVWLFARSGLHAGASGLVMGYWGYLISSAIFDRNLKSLMIAIITIALYGGIVFSLLDFRQSVSFEGHLFGFLAGIFSAWLPILRTKNNRKQARA
nr:rhomboid family intramembrane serine protease [Aliikangiella sp. G2MR2-5]